MPTSLVETVARELLMGFNEWVTLHPEERQKPIPAWETLEPKQQAFLLFQARVAIKAMRQPANSMLLAGDEWQDGSSDEIWKAMIDQALVEEGAKHGQEA